MASAAQTEKMQVDAQAVANQSNNEGLRQVELDNQHQTNATPNYQNE